MLTMPIDRITMLLEQASLVGSASAEDSEESETETVDETESGGAVEEFADLPGYRELTVMLGDLTAEEVYELLALAAIGSGELADDSWEGAIAQAQSVAADEAVSELARVLVATDAIENALDRLGYSLLDEDEDDEDEDDEEEEDEDEDDEEEKP